MAIKDLQRRQTQAGRIRIGETKDTGKKDKHGRPIMRPVKLEAFRFTSPSKTLIEQVAAAYGGMPAEWHPQGGGAMQWEVYTEARALPVVVPPSSVSQWYETWAGGSCVLRCDGEREVLKDRPCQCSPDPAERQCKPVTRMSLMLADVPGIGVWRLDTSGYYAATELPAVAELLAAAGGYVSARLELEERSARRPKADGSGMETRRWMVPVLHVDAAPAQLLALTGGGRTELEGGARATAIAASPSTPPAEETSPASGIEELTARINATMKLEDLRALWIHIGETATLTQEQTAELIQVFWDRQKQINGRAAAQTAVDAGGGPAEVLTAAMDAHAEQDVNVLWTAVLGAVNALGWTTSDTSRHYREQMGHDPADADAKQMSGFLEWVKSGALAEGVQP